MTGRHKASALFWGGLGLWLAGGFVGVAADTAHPWDAVLYLGAVLMISGLYYQSVLKLKEQLSEAEDKFQALLALSGGEVSVSPNRVNLAAGDVVSVRCGPHLVNIVAETGCSLRLGA